LLQNQTQKDECFILIKALPHRSSKYFETVCCAGIGRDGNWRRQYPVPFRILNDTQQFKRWDWIEYDYIRSPSDTRKESQKVIPETLKVGKNVKQSERSRILSPKIRSSFAEANSLGESLTLLRPTTLEIVSKKKSAAEIADEQHKHAALADQMSLFDSTAKPLKTCPMIFKAKWTDSEGKTRTHECDDWETSAAYNRFESMYGPTDALKFLKEKYEDQYFNAGLILGFSTHSRRNVEFGTDNQWLLVGIIRLDYNEQISFL
jgi:hypothetical protein